MYLSNNLAMMWELRDGDGNVINTGITGGKRSWLLHEKYKEQNILLRAKTASGIGKSANTKPCDGPGDVCRKLEDGSTLHAYLRPDIDPDLVADMNLLEKTIENLTDERARIVIRDIIRNMNASVTGDDDFLK